MPKQSICVPVNEWQCSACGDDSNVLSLTILCQECMQCVVHIKKVKECYKARRKKDAQVDD